MSNVFYQEYRLEAFSLALLHRRSGQKSSSGSLPKISSSTGFAPLLTDIHRCYQVASQVHIQRR